VGPNEGKTPGKDRPTRREACTKGRTDLQAFPEGNVTTRKKKTNPARCQGGTQNQDVGKGPTSFDSLERQGRRRKVARGLESQKGRDGSKPGPSLRHSNLVAYVERGKGVAWEKMRPW